MELFEFEFINPSLCKGNIIKANRPNISNNFSRIVEFKNALMFTGHLFCIALLLLSRSALCNTNIVKPMIMPLSICMPSTLYSVRFELCVCNSRSRIQKGNLKWAWLLSVKHGKRECGNVPTDPNDVYIRWCKSKSRRSHVKIVI